MNKTLHELYYGNFRGFDRTYHPKSEYGRALSRLVELETQLLEKIPEEAEAIYQEMDAAWNEITSLTGEWGFETGFRLGARMMLAVEEPDANLIPAQSAE